MSPTASFEVPTSGSGEVTARGLYMKKTFYYIKFWAFIYRLTGYYHKAIDSQILYYILANIDSIKSKSKGYRSLERGISTEIGYWQAKHGFYREFVRNEDRTIRFRRKK